MNQWKLTDLIVKKIIFTDESVNGKTTDSICEDLTDSDLESMLYFIIIILKNNRNLGKSRCNSNDS